jgi:CheY-like chemotaxis protein
LVSGDYELKSAFRSLFQESDRDERLSECMATGVLQTPSVLLMNDARDEREMYARTLRAYGYQVVKAPTSVAAYQIAVSGRADIVVTDVHITGSMTGLELTRRLRIHAGTTTLPVIVLADVSRPQILEKVREIAAN